MTEATAKTVAAAVLDAGFNASVFQRPAGSGTWIVQASSPLVNIPVASAASLAVSQSVAGNISLIEYS